MLRRHRAQILGFALTFPGALGAQTLLSSTPAGQPLMLADRGPAFYAVLGSGRVERLDAAHTVALTKRIALRLDQASVPEALRAIGAVTGLRFTYDRSVLPNGPPVTLHAEDITVAAALTQVLLDANVDVEITPAGIASIHARRTETQQAQQQTGTITGRVLDAKTGIGIRDATVILEKTPYGATTRDSGQYRIANVPIGTYTVVARIVGYTARRQSVTVAAGQRVLAEFTLARALHELDRIVTTGTLVPTAEMALPIPITVITDSAIADQQPWSITQIVQQDVPSALAFTYPTDPQTTAISVRGVSTLNTFEGAMKIYIDGIEAASKGNDPVDPNSIDHIEVISGPEAATLYGSDAISGVMNIFTKHGDSTALHPQVDAQTALGVIQSPYPGYSGALRQDYSASVQGGTPAASYGVGGSYDHNGPWALEAESGIASAWGGFHIAQGPVALDFTGRSYETHTPEALNPDLLSVGYPYYSQPFYQQWDSRNQTLGAHIVYATTSWWHQSVTLGIDQIVGDGRQTQARLTSPADTFLVVEVQDLSKMSIGYNSSLLFHLGPALTANVVIGLDHYNEEETATITAGALTTIGAVASPGQPPELIRDLVTNTGYFTQAQIAWRDALFITIGVRAEENSSFGTDVGTPVSQRFGASYVTALNGTTIRVRSSFGEAIAPPNPLLANSIISPPFVQVANPLLGPERQRGWDGGVDIIPGRYLSVGLTYFNQLATDLIEDVSLDTTGLVSQNQNIGRVHNSGGEVEATVTVGRLELHGQYAYTNSIVNSLGSAYTGDLRVGEQVFAIPHSTAGASASLSPYRTLHISAGVSVVGSLIDYNYLAEFACVGGTGPCASTTRGYLVRYPTYTRVNASVSQQLDRIVSAFVSVDNLLNSTSYEAIDLYPVEGRVTMVGLRVHY